MKTATANLEKPIILATETKFHNKVLGCYKEQVQIILAEELSSLLQVLSENIGATLLLDLSLFNDDVDHPTVKTIFKKGIEQRIIVVTNEQNPAKLYKLLEQGARGYFQSTISDELLMKAIKAVNEGELWIERNIIGYLISEQLQGRTRKSGVTLDPMLSDSSLTSRESAIAKCVSQGKCNKIIARDLSISLSTVKSHLHNIFEKLQVADRLQLAIVYHEIKLD